MPFLLGTFTLLESSFNLQNFVRRIFASSSFTKGGFFSLGLGLGAKEEITQSLGLGLVS